MYGPYPMGGRANRSWETRPDDTLGRYLRSEYRSAETRDSFLVENPENGVVNESAIRRLVKIVLLNPRRMKPTPVEGA